MIKMKTSKKSKVEKCCDIVTKSKTASDQIIKLPPFITKRVLLTASIPISWSLKQLKVPDTWKVTQGENITSLVIDTGMPTHKDIVSNILTAKCKDFTGEGLEDLNSHSTFVCSEIAATNMGGFIGFAPQSKIITAKVLGKDGSGTLNGILDALDYAIDIQNDYQIINMSLGFPVYDADFEKRIQALSKAGKIIICAAGNEQRGQGNQDTMAYPGRFKEAIAIGAYDSQGNIADYSSIGDELDFVFPGSDILGCGLGNTYVIMSGTSMATPCAGGTAALCLAKHKKQEAMGGPNDCQTQDQLVEHFKKYSIDKGTIGKDRTYGWGAVDVDDLIVQGEGSTPTPTPTPITPVQLNFIKRIINFLFGWL